MKTCVNMVLGFHTDGTKFANMLGVHFSLLLFSRC